MAEPEVAARAAAASASSPRTALVLSGGGVTGFLYEIGALAALEEALQPASVIEYVEIFVGTSAGAVGASLLANGASPRAIYRALHGNEESPFNFHLEDVYGTAARNFGQLMRQFTQPFVGAIGRALRRRIRPTLNSILSDFQEHHPPGFYSTEPLERTLCERFTALGYAHEFSRLPRTLCVTGTDIDTGERLVFGKGEFGDLHICRAVAASCTIPIFFRPVRVGERDVVDGAIGESTPIDIALEHGANRIIYINPLVPIRNDRARLCLPLGDAHCARLSEKGVGWIGEQALRLMRATKLTDTMTALLARNPHVTIRTIQPSEDELPMFMHSMMSFAARQELLEYGYHCGRRAVESDPAMSLQPAAPALP